MQPSDCTERLWSTINPYFLSFSFSEVGVCLAWLSNWSGPPSARCWKLCLMTTTSMWFMWVLSKPLPAESWVACLCEATGGRHDACWEKLPSEMRDSERWVWTALCIHPLIHVLLCIRMKILTWKHCAFAHVNSLMPMPTHRLKHTHTHRQTERWMTSNEIWISLRSGHPETDL